MIISTARTVLSKRWRFLQELILAPLAMVGLSLFAFRQFLEPGRSSSTFQDNTYLLHPLFSYISKSFSNGEFPYWVNSLMAGLPLYGTPQFSITYPFYFFHSGLYSDPLSALTQLHYVPLFHIAILYFNSYFLLRILRIGPLAALLGA